ncbi:hypothetical protein [Bacillus cereus]
MSNDENIEGFLSDSYFMNLTDGVIEITSNGKGLLAYWGYL